MVSCFYGPILCNFLCSTTLYLIRQARKPCTVCYIETCNLRIVKLLKLCCCICCFGFNFSLFNASLASLLEAASAAAAAAAALVIFLMQIYAVSFEAATGGVATVAAALVLKMSDCKM